MKIQNITSRLRWVSKKKKKKGDVNRMSTQIEIITNKKFDDVIRNNVNRGVRTYIIGHCKPMNYYPVSHSTYALFVNITYERRDLQTFRKLFHGNFIYFPSLSRKSTERQSTKKYFFLYFIFQQMSGRDLTSNKTKHIHGDYTCVRLV